MSVLTRQDENYVRHFELWQQVRAVLKGKYAIVEDLVSSLPGPQYRTYNTYSDMTPEQHRSALAATNRNTLRVKSYWSRGRFFNATGRTYESLGGMIWSQDPDKMLSQRLEYLEVNANGAGYGLNDIAKKITDELIAVGRYGVLVDMPEAPTNEDGQTVTLTQEQSESGEFAPRLIQYFAEQIIYFRVSNNSNSVDEIRLEEMESVQKNEFEWEDVVYTRRLVLVDGIYHNQRYSDKDELISDVVPIANGSPLDYIPFQFFGADDNSPEFSKVPLYDLANMNLGHFVLDCDNRDNLHFHGQGMTNVFTEMDPDEFAEANPNGLDSGAKGVNQFSQGDKVELLQLDATGAIPTEMARDQERMISLGAQLVTDNSANETATAKKIDSNASMSTLKRIAKNTTEGINNLLVMVSDFLGVTEESYYMVNTNFITDELSPQMLQVHMALVQSRILPESTLLESSRKAGLTEKTDDQIKDDLENQNELTGGMSEREAELQARIDVLEAEAGGEV